MTHSAAKRGEDDATIGLLAVLDLGGLAVDRHRITVGRRVGDLKHVLAIVGDLLSELVDAGDLRHAGLTLLEELLELSHGIFEIFVAAKESIRLDDGAGASVLFPLAPVIAVGADGEKAAELGVGELVDTAVVANGEVVPHTVGRLKSDAVDLAQGGLGVLVKILGGDDLSPWVSHLPHNVAS